MAEGDIRYKITYEDDGASATLNKVASAAKKTGDETKAASASIGTFGSSIGLAGQAVSRLNPALGGIVTMAGSATGAIQSLTTAGMGPLGLAVAGISLAVTAGTAIWGLYKQKVDDAAEAARNATTASDDLAASIANQLTQLRAAMSAQANAAHIQDVMSGQGTVEEQRALVETRQAALNAVQRASVGRAAMGAVRDAEDDLREAQGLLDESIAVRGRLAAKAEVDMQANRQTAADERARREEEAARRGSAGDADRLARELKALEMSRQKTADTGGPSLDQLMLGGNGMDVANGLEGISPMSTLSDAEIDAWENKKAWLEQRDKEIVGMAQENADQLTEINNSVFTAMEAGMRSSLDAWLSGQKSFGEAALGMVRDVAKSILIESVLNSLKETAIGIQMLAGVYTAGLAPGHFVAAAKWAAVGAVAAAVGGASGAFGSSSAGGGGAASGPSPMAGPSPGGAAGEKGGGTVNIIFGNGMLYAADRAQMGRDMRTAIEDANMRLGRGA